MPNKAVAPGFDYIAEALVTLSHDWHGAKISREDFLNSLNNSIGHLKQLDRIKKSIFYGRDFLFAYDAETETVASLPVQLCQQDKNITSKEIEYIFHAIIGVATEAGELLEVLQSAIIGKPIDFINIKEEQGDSFWYHAILASICGISFEEIQHVNIAKLRTRYPDKFQAFDANNRNLEAERSILEQKVIAHEIEYTGIDKGEEKDYSMFQLIPFSQRGIAWCMFAIDVLSHVENYTVPQYGDKGEDQVTDWTAEQCVKTAKKYLDRFNKNQRPGQEKLDLLKCAHYVQLALEKMEE